MDVGRIVFNELQRLDVPQAELSDEGQSSVMDYIENYGNVPRSMFYAALPSDWSWEWKVQHGTYAGTLSKRIQSFLFKTFQRKLSDDVVTKIGNIAVDHTLEAREFLFDFDRSLDWSAGDFGDSGSCFWTQKPWSLPMLQHFGGMSLRLYQQTSPLENPQGIGRALLLPWSKESGYIKAADWVDHTDALMVFNGYGAFAKQYGKSGSGQRYGNMQVLDYGRLLALYLGVSYERVILWVNESDSNPLYINNGGYAIMVGPTEIVSRFKPAGKVGSKQYRPINVAWPKAEIDQFIAHCAHCDNMVTLSGDIPTARHGRRGPDGHIYCDRCYGEVFVHCLVCGIEMNSRNADVISSTLIGSKGRIFLCPEHTPAYSFVCTQCEAQYYIGDKMYYHVPADPVYRAPRRLECCRRCYHENVIVATCAGCKRDYAVEYLRVHQPFSDNLDHYNRQIIILCPQCRYKAEAKAAGTAPKDGEEQPPLLLLSPESPALQLRGQSGKRKTLGELKASISSSSPMFTTGAHQGANTVYVVAGADRAENVLMGINRAVAADTHPLGYRELYPPPGTGPFLNRIEAYLEVWPRAEQPPSRDNLLDMERQAREDAIHIVERQWGSRDIYRMHWSPFDSADLPLLSLMMNRWLWQFGYPYQVFGVNRDAPSIVGIVLAEIPRFVLTLQACEHLDEIATAIQSYAWVPATSPWHESIYEDRELVQLARNAGLPAQRAIQNYLNRALALRHIDWLQVYSAELIRHQVLDDIWAYRFTPYEQPH